MIGDVRDITICVRDIKCHQSFVTVNWRIEDWGEAKSTYIFENAEDPVEEEVVDEVVDEVDDEETVNSVEDENEHDEKDNHNSEITVESDNHSENPTISNLKQTIEGIEKTLNEVKQLVLTIG